jgi:hypothetical protein
MALDFTAATNAHVACGTKTAFDLSGVTQCTLAVWVYGKRPTGNSGRVLECHTSGTIGYTWVWETSGIIYCQRGRATSANDINATDTNFAAHAAVDMWRFLVARLDNATSTNNALWMGTLTHPPSPPSTYGSQTAGSGTMNSGATLLLGNRNALNRNFIGHLLSVQLFNRGLTDGEVRQLWRQRLTGLSSWRGCVGAWCLGQPGTSVQRDYSPTGGHGTVTSAVWAPTPPVLTAYRRAVPWWQEVAAAAGQPFVKRHGGTPFLRLGGPTFGYGWGY